MQIEIAVAMLAAMLIGGAIAVSASCVTGYLVFRANRAPHEAQLFPKKRPERIGPVNIDPLGAPGMSPHEEKDTLSPVLKKMNERAASLIAVESAKAQAAKLRGEANL